MKINQHLRVKQSENYLKITSQPNTSVAKQSLLIVGMLFILAIIANIAIPSILYTSINILIVAAVAWAINPLEYFNTYSIIVENDTLTLNTSTYFNKTKIKTFETKDIDQLFVNKEQKELLMLMNNGRLLNIRNIRYNTIHDLIAVERIIENHIGIANRDIIYYTNKEEETLILAR